MLPFRGSSPEAARRRQVEAHLAHLRTLRDDPEGRSLPRILEDLGPVFAGFGRYLASRVDLLSESDRTVLRGLTGRRPPLEPAAVVTAVETAFEATLGELFESFEALPVAQGAHAQIHRARWNGTPVRVRVVDPRAETEVARDLPLLELLEPAFGDELAPAALARAARDFGEAARRARDATLQAGHLEALAHDSREIFEIEEGPCWPAVVKARTAPGVLTVEEIPGTPVDAGAGASGVVWAEEAAIRLARGWLHAASLGSACPVDFDADDWVMTADRRPAWIGGVLDGIDEGARRRLWSYLQAVAACDPDAACAELSGELTADVDSEDGARERSLALRQRLRQAVPSRDGGWGARDDLAAEVFTHARIVTELGFRPSPSLLVWWRSLAHLSALTRPGAWRRDPLHEAVDASRLVRDLGSLMERADPEEVQAALGRAVHTFLTLPRKLDRVLSVAADGRTSLRVEMVEPEERRRRKDTSTAALVAALAIGALVLLTHRLVPLLPAPWGERIAAVILLMGGLLLLPRLVR